MYRNTAKLHITRTHVGLVAVDWLLGLLGAKTCSLNHQQCSNLAAAHFATVILQFALVCHGKSGY